MPIQITPTLLNWASDIEPGTIDQAARTSRLPFIAGHVALMPDAHVGIGSTVGSVIPTQGAIVPAAIGVDIGCGMAAVRLGITVNGLPDNLDGLHSALSLAIPSGVGKGHEADRGIRLGDVSSREMPELTQKQIATAVNQFGTLGSGNHFVEICLDEADDVWLVLHSGSRGIGNQLARVHIDGAKALMKRYFIELEDKDLAYLVEGTSEFAAYIGAMQWAQDYAAGNRARMVDDAIATISGWLGRDLPCDQVINAHHNYTTREHHHGRNIWVTRKGAIGASNGELGIIPGSMGARTYIVRGKGNPASYGSCSHGAGRRMSRSEARRTLDRQGLTDAMVGKAWNGDAEALIDEDPRSYKDIDQVMADQRDLVDVVHTLHQILNLKGL